MRIGFTGTRNGLTDAQRVSLGTFLVPDLYDKPPTFHHGACKGADTDAAKLVRSIDPDAYIVAHPGVSAKGGDNEFFDADAVALSNEVRETKTHFARNRDIVNETDMLIGCPGADTWQQRGGTFYTMDYAIKQGKPCKVIWPDGCVEDR